MPNYLFEKSKSEIHAFIKYHRTRGAAQYL